MLCTTSYFFKNTQYVIDTFIILPNGTNIITIVMFDPSQNVLPILLCALINVVVVWMTVNELNLGYFSHTYSGRLDLPSLSFHSRSLQIKYKSLQSLPLKFSIQPIQIFWFPYSCQMIGSIGQLVS